MGAESGLQHSLLRLFQPAGYEVVMATSEADALTLVGASAFDVALMDIQKSGTAGLDTFRRLRKADPKLQVVLITAFGSADLAIEAVQMGAYDYLLKPFEVATLEATIARAAQIGHLTRTRVTIEPPPVVDPSEDRIVGTNRGMQEVYKRIGQVAGTDVPVLIRGETGTGKELVARAIYQHSRRADRAFSAVNCAAIPEGLLESEMFGHERGAFTNAVARRVGKFEQANRGTIFLDEIGDMAIGTQAKILRVLQDGVFERLGGDTEVKVDVRVIAATHRDLEADVHAGRFREDLYYRLNVVSLVLPPIRDRKDDLPRLIDFFVGRFCAELGVERVAISSAALERLIFHDWPGNVRELENCLKDAILSCQGGVIAPEDVHLAARPASRPGVRAGSGADSSQRRRAGDAPGSGGSPSPSGGDSCLAGLDDPWLDSLTGNLHTVVIREVERRLLLYTLRRCDNNQVHAAQLLGISRSMLRDRLQRYERTAGEGPGQA